MSLYTLFSTYGPVLDVVAMKTPKMRGQAHIVYRDIQASTQAMRALQGFDFFGKEMVSFHMPGHIGVKLTVIENSVRQRQIKRLQQTRRGLSPFQPCAECSSVNDLAAVHL